ncbi:uncharacterized protein LOC131977318 [Centropristis striata]|uniref:uncharacterized protein LOC131977318 n=1 Tax=Centropristis striata TaxID=184440 RepID=UPI0027E14CC0|nr:uncharacterized protein LOC131977318 [Centropristis striata]
MAEKQQPAMRKLPIPPLPTTAYTAKTRKTNKTNDEKQAKKKECDRARNKTRINIGAAFPRWRELQELKGFKNDAQLATFLLDSYLQTKSENQSELPSLERESSSETCESVPPEYQFMMTSPSEVEQETSVQSSENGMESGKKAVERSPKSQDHWTITNQSENKENRDIKEDKDEEFSTSLSVGDGCYLVDLGSSSEFIVDEECLLQLFKSCRECSRQCTVRKRVTGLKLVVSQTCDYCQRRLKWTNLLDDDDDGDFQINGKDSALGQTNSAC